MNRIPRIGITPDINDVAAPEMEYVVRQNYAEAISQAGGLPFLLPYGNDIDQYLDSLDGLLITGGMFDIDPSLYRQTARKQYVMKPVRTNFEQAMINGAIERSMPVLGICNGMQLLAVCLGGELVQDIPTEVDGPLEHKPDSPASGPHHAITVPRRPRHLEIQTGSTYEVNSVHHQSVLPSDAYLAFAFSDDGVVEAIEAKAESFAIGVQWHPEYGVSAIDRLVFDGFVAEAAKFSRREK